MTIKKILNVKEHYKYLRDGKKHLWREHTRVDRDCFTEENNSEHKEFIKEFMLFHIHDKFEYIESCNYEVMIGNERRCDVLVVLNNGKKMCIECQLSKISRKNLYDRTFYYLHSGYEVKWVLPYIYNEYIFTRLIKYCGHLGYSCYIKLIYLVDIGHYCVEYNIFHKKTVFDKHKVKIGS